MSFTPNLVNGDGMSIFRSGGEWYAEFDNLTVRKSMRIKELIISKTRAINGALVVSSACGIIKTVTVNGQGDYDITFEDDNSFSVNDLLECQNYSNTFGVKYYLVEVYSVSGSTVTLLADSFNGQSLPEVGDEIASIGNTANTARQGMIKLSSNENDNPRIVVYDGVNSSVLAGKEKVVIGKLDGIEDPSFLFGNPSGYGIYTDNGYFQDCFVSGIVSSNLFLQNWVIAPPESVVSGSFYIPLANGFNWNFCLFDSNQTCYLPDIPDSLIGATVLLYYGRESVNQYIAIAVGSTGDKARFVNKYSGTGLTSPATVVSIDPGKMLRLRAVRTIRSGSSDTNRWYIENPEDCLIMSTELP